MNKVYRESTGKRLRKMRNDEAISWAIAVGGIVILSYLFVSVFAYVYTILYLILA